MYLGLRKKNIGSGKFAGTDGDGPETTPSNPHCCVVTQPFAHRLQITEHQAVEGGNPTRLRTTVDPNYIIEGTILELETTMPNPPTSQTNTIPGAIAPLPNQSPPSPAQAKIAGLKQRLTAARELTQNISTARLVIDQTADPLDALKTLASASPAPTSEDRQARIKFGENVAANIQAEIAEVERQVELRRGQWQAKGQELQALISSYNQAAVALSAQKSRLVEAMSVSGVAELQAEFGSLLKVTGRPAVWSDPAPQLFATDTGVELK